VRFRLALARSMLGLLTLVAGCGEVVGQSPDPSEFHPAWQRLPDLPLDPRSGPVIAWTGAEVLVVGGDTGPPCAPNASCVAREHYARDGVRLAIEGTSWRRMADAPVDIPAYSQSAMIDGSLYVVTRDALLGYDVATDTWSEIPTPPGFSEGALIADGHRLVVASGSDEQRPQPDRIYDPRSKQWSTLPDDPIGPAFDRVVTAIPGALVLTAKKLVDNPGADGPALVLAARFDEDTQAWTRLPDSDQLGGWAWTWTGRRLVDPTLGGADGGEVGNYGRTIPMGGILDPAAGRWSRLPRAPKQGTGGWPVAALGGRFVAVGGWTYDDESETWAEVPRPSGAPEQPGAAVWADDRLVVVGGLDPDAGYTTDAMSRRSWISQSGATLGRPLL
jgi:hypothetical protein